MCLCCFSRICFRKWLVLLCCLLGGISSSICAAEHLPDSAWVEGIGSDSVMIRFLSEAGVSVTEQNRVKLLRCGRAKFEDLFEAVRAAKHHIHLEYFNFRNDSIAAELFTLLVMKAKEGVEVRALFDAFGNASNNRPLKRDMLDSLRAHGIEIVKFDPIRFPYLNHIAPRDHRKIVVIDGRVGYTGGMNVADYYVEGLPKIGPWHDMHVRIEGEAVADLQRIFLEIWNHETHQCVEGADYFPLLRGGGSTSVAIVDRNPRENPKLMRRALIAAIDAAQEKIRVVNPYFLPTKSVKRAFRRALERGVEVEILLSQKSDIGFTPDGSKRYGYKLVKRGAEVYLYTGGFHHAKVMLFDDSFSTVGSTNLDSRSLRYDYEVNAFFFDREVTDDLVTIFEEDKAQSVLLTKELWKKRSLWRKFVGWVASLMTPFL